MLLERILYSSDFFVNSKVGNSLITVFISMSPFNSSSLRFLSLSFSSSIFLFFSINNLSAHALNLFHSFCSFFLPAGPILDHSFLIFLNC